MKLLNKARDALKDPFESFQRFLKDWEWTWTRAVLVSLGISLFILIAVIIIPSFWMYYAEAELRWGGSSDIAGAFNEIFNERTIGPAVKNQIRDIVAMGLTVGPFVTLCVAAAWMQNTRRKLRGETGDTRPSGGYR